MRMANGAGVTVDLVEFLTKRIEEDEAAARAATAHSGHWRFQSHTDDVYFLDHTWPDTAQIVEDLPVDVGKQVGFVTDPDGNIESGLYTAGLDRVVAERDSPAEYLSEHPDPEQRPHWPQGIWRPTGPVEAPEFEHIARWDPARVLAECQAKRRIIQQYHDLRANEDYYHEDLGGGALMLALQHLAVVYADHPDYPLERTRRGIWESTPTRAELDAATDLTEGE
jgi:Family of unknown function (DUF6221)